MKIHSTRALMTLVGALGLTTAASAQRRVDHGKVEYDAHCANCHGASGRGRGRGNGELR